MRLVNNLKIEDFQKVIFDNEKIELDESLIQRVDESFQFLKEFSDKKVIYGVNTGFGPMAQYRIAEQDKYQLQYNLIRSHASGVGTPLKPRAAKASMLARLNTLSQGKSAVHPSVILLLKELINQDVTPLIFEHGGVGASGDLVQLAHLALVLIGEGEVFYKGERRPTAEVYKELGLTPINIELREGIGLMNGTSVMSGIGIINSYNTKKLIDFSIRMSCAINEIVQAYDDHFSESLNSTKRHSGQQKVAGKMREYLRDSQLIRKREDHLYNKETQEEIFKDKVQEYYSLRCVPQILGPVLDTLEFSEKVLEDEINSANDNPIIIPEEKHVYHGGNFHGDYVSLEMDKLKLVVTRLTMLAERQLNYLLNSKINEILPPFVNLGRLGFNFGMQGVQFTAVSTTAENQALSTSMYIHSIPNNNDNQDIVSMGTNAAVMCEKVINNAYEVLAIEVITIVQAIEYLEFKDRVSSSTRKLYDEVREIVPAFKEDLVMYPFVEKIKNYLINN
ncbi:aromatic amino acid lyase [Marnyiella aurantia]|uniref:Aromatic amino acid lyase n=1 Tax=Marnyiella aurantia TaxID=2758037 RepID=A0A7D7RHU3_9FLAO|nr:aromatic amino acid ammonia-lyase [Marnyiella aurantia]MBA5247243.1 aromatic amino acid lyase [Marnyiella aurantia]QMS97432.1 aromatic amino acid lyase [Marnyiella aurantia]